MSAGAKARAWIGVALGAAVVAGCGEAPAPPQSGEPNAFFGINGQLLRAMSATDEDEAVLSKQLNAIAEADIGFVRANIDWTALEPAPPAAGVHTYDFAGLDEWVTALVERDLEWQATIVGIPTPQWASDPAVYAQCGFRSAPARAADVVALVDAIARRYGHGGTFWRDHPDLPDRPLTQFEIWNEANFGSFWCPEPDPELYAELLVGAARAVHAVDPDAQVIMGGLAGFRESRPAQDTAAMTAADEFLLALADAEPDLVHEVDQVGVHSYQRTPDGVLDDLAFYRDALRAAGFGEIPMTLNETGAFTSGNAGMPPLPEEERAALLGEVSALVSRTDCNVVSYAPHAWTTSEEDAADPEDWYGIVDPESAEAYPSGVAYLEEIQRFQVDASPGERLDVCGPGSSR